MNWKIKLTYDNNFIILLYTYKLSENQIKQIFLPFLFYNQ